MTRRGGTIVLGLLGALLIGGVSQTWLWRAGATGLAGALGSQFTWALLCFGVAWAWAEDGVGQGAAAGGATGLALIVSYYLTQWVADGRHAAVSQFSKTGGTAWAVAAVLGGALLGAFGGLASRDGRDRSRSKALGLATPAVIAVGGPALWLLTQGNRLDPTRLLPALSVFVVASVSLLVHAVRTCGAVPTLKAVGASVLIGAGALGVLLWLQTHGWLYLTF